MRIAADQRSLDLEPDYEGGLDVALRLGTIRKHQIELARKLLVLSRKRHFALHGYASLTAWTRHLGLGEIETRQLMNIALAILAAPALRWHIIARRISFEAAALLGTLARLDGMRLDETDVLGQTQVIDTSALDWEAWMRDAQELPSADFRRLVRKERQALRQRAEVVEIVIPTCEDTRDKFRRAQQIASRRSNRLLNSSETLSVISDHYLDRFDPLRRAQRAGKRSSRSAPSGLPRNPSDASNSRPGRYIPAAAQHDIRLRANDRCEVPGCGHSLGLEFAHIVPHHRGGSRDTDNLLLLCHRHHVLFDSGILRLIERRSEGFVFESVLGNRFEPSVAHATTSAPSSSASANRASDAASASLSDSDPP